MRALFLGFLAMLFSVSAIAQEAAPIESVVLPHRYSAQVVVTPDGESLLVTIALDRPVDRLDLDRADVVRDDTLAVLTPGLHYADDAISGDQFSIVTLRLTEDLTERDAKYAPYYRVGEGRMFYAQTVYPDLEVWDVTLQIAELPTGWARWPDEPLPQGYLFLGPQAEIQEEGGARFVFDGSGDAAFESEIRETVSSSIGWLTDTFGSPPADIPFIATNLVTADRAYNRGSVTDNAMIVLRFGGNAEDAITSRQIANTRSLILHEGVHFWNGGVARFAQGTPQWLHEGGAEYIATLASIQLGWTSLEDMQVTSANWLARCSTSLSYSDEVALNELTFINSSLRYSCGPLLHLLAELYLAESGSAPTVVEGWRNTIRIAAATPEREYAMPDFLAALQTPDLLERPALAAILATSGPERWGAVMAEMQRLGVAIEQTTTPTLRARTALMHLMRGQCTQLQPGEGYGFYSNATHYKLDAPEGCGIVTGDYEVTTLAGYDLLALTGDDYAALQAICAAGGSVAFRVEDDGEIDVPCTSPLPSSRTQPAISAFPEIRAFE